MTQYRKDAKAHGDLTPRVLNGLLEVPVYYMRGGTSTGAVLHRDHVPQDRTLCEELLLHIFGNPLAGQVLSNPQITGLGRGTAQSSKAFIVGHSEQPNADIDSTLAQLSPTKSDIDWSVNCGNMSSCLPFFAESAGLINTQPGRNVIRIFNTNTQVTTHAIIEHPNDGERKPTASTIIPGVMGQWPAVQLALLDPAGAKTQKLFPTGAPIDDINGIQVSCVDLAVPMVIAKAEDFGKTGDEPPSALIADEIFIQKIRDIWVEAGIKMKLTKAAGAAMTRTELATSETVPKFCIISTPGQAEKHQGANIRVRYFTPQDAHSSLAVTGGACLATACLVPGTLAHRCAKNLNPLTSDLKEHTVAMANPAGIMRARVNGQVSNNQSSSGHYHIPSVSYERNAQILMRGHVPIYNASPALKSAYAAYSI